MLLSLYGALGLSVAGCNKLPAMLISVTADTLVEQYDLYIREDATGTIIFHSGYNPVLAPGEKPDNGTDTRDLTKGDLKIAVKLSRGGKFTLLLVGVTGMLDGSKPAIGATQLFWAGHVDVSGPTSVSARLLTVPAGDDQDRDLWPDATDFPAHVAEAATLYANAVDLLDCDDKADSPTGTNGVIMIKAESVNPFAPEICGDGYDENCDGNADEPCVDKDHDGDPGSDDCDDNDPARHHPTVADPFPDPPNCCGYSLGKTAPAEAGTDYLHDAAPGDPNCFAASCTHDLTLCPMARCGDGIDESCRGSDTACIVDADCDGEPATTDCDDHNPAIHHGATEICGNGINESCNANGADQGCVACDLDGDGYERMDPPNGCPDANDMHMGMLDCDDYDAGVYPGATSATGKKEGGVNANSRIATALKGLCRRVYEPTGTTGTAKVGVSGYIVGDADCNGVAYEACPDPSCDADGDGWPKDGSCGQMGPYDCDDGNPTIFPGAPDYCGDGVDGSCSGADTPCNGMDADGDHYLPPADCNDNDPKIHPFATELCNQIDDDCDGNVDEGNPTQEGAPMVAANALISCNEENVGVCMTTPGVCVCSRAMQKIAIDAVPANRIDCPDFAALSTSAVAQKPQCFGAKQPTPQSCTGTDQDDDCNGTSSVTAANASADTLLGFGQACGLTKGQCMQGTLAGCDRSQTISPYYGAQATADDVHWVCANSKNPLPAELCNGFDDTCLGSLSANEIDSDGDHYISCGTACSSTCGPPCGIALAPGLLGTGDCGEPDATRHPCATEICNGVDDNCDGTKDEVPNECSAVAATDLCCGNMGYACRDTTSDLANCNGCGIACPALTTNQCKGSGCICKASGAACPSSGSWCDSGNNGGTCTSCNSTGHCGPSCIACTGGNVCNSMGTACTGCNSDADCDASHTAGTTYCLGGTCTPRKAKGAACSNAPSDTPDDECLQTSGALYCTDGVCCDTKPSMCGGCLQCNKGGSQGSCVPAMAGTDPHNFCNANTATCQLANCNNSGSCYAGDSTICVAQVCMDNTPVAGQAEAYDYLCAGGACSVTPNVVAMCGDYTCNGTNCYSSCTTNAQCEPGKPNCWPTSVGGDGKCTSLKIPGSNCAANAECLGGACVSGKCCAALVSGSATRPGSCGAITTSTSCSNAPLPPKTTTYTCKSASNYTSCSNSVATCGTGLNCNAASTDCYMTCSCSGTYPCAPPPPAGDTTPECLAGYFCPSAASSTCNTCNTTSFCGATCDPCTAACSNGMISGNACTGGTTCSTAAACTGNYICADGSSCKTDCASDSDCTSGLWCKTAGPPNTCDTRIASGQNCDDASCKASGCKQCNMGGTGVACPMGMGQQKCP